MRKGLIKRVCDGSTARIWHDRWLPGHFTDQQVVEKVSYQRYFFPVHANAILKLSVMARIEDFWAWEKERHDNYYVKSAYRLQEDMRETGLNHGLQKKGSGIWFGNWMSHQKFRYFGCVFYMIISR